MIPKPAKVLRNRNAFTLAVPGVETLKESDFFGIATGNKMADKFERTGLHAVKSSKVDAPVIEEYPLTLECRVVDYAIGDVIGKAWNAGAGFMKK